MKNPTVTVTNPNILVSPPVLNGGHGLCKSRIPWTNTGTLLRLPVLPSAIMAAAAASAVPKPVPNRDWTRNASRRGALPLRSPYFKLLGIMMPGMMMVGIALPCYRNG